MTGRAAEIAQPAPEQIDLLLADAGAVVQVLDIVLELQPAAFQQGYPDVMPEQFHRQRDAGRTGTDDADISFYGLTVGEISKIDEHLLINSVNIARAFRNSEK